MAGRRTSAKLQNSFIKLVFFPALIGCIFICIKSRALSESSECNKTDYMAFYLKKIKIKQSGLGD